MRARLRFNSVPRESTRPRRNDHARRDFERRGEVLVRDIVPLEAIGGLRASAAAMKFFRRGPLFGMSDLGQIASSRQGR
jgi:hypothetical protein